jgi:CubicO group peptidase (beta-lactamase class C family)
LAQSVFVQGGAQASHLTQAATLGKVVGKESFGWGGLGGSALWFNPVDEIGFGYAVTGATFGLAGDPGRLGPIYDALNDCFGFYSKSKL